MNYKVVKGDTLSEIANRFRTSVSKIMKENPTIKDPDKIVVGMTIRISTSDSDSSENYDSLGKAFQRALNDISKLDSVKELLKYEW